MMRHRRACGDFLRSRSPSSPAGRILPDCPAPFPANIRVMTLPNRDTPSSSPDTGAPKLDALVRERLGRHLQALYEPVLDESLDPRLAELLRQLDRDRQGGPEE